MTITGTGFLPGYRVYQHDGVYATSVVVVNSTTMTAVMMPHSAGVNWVSVMATGNTADAQFYPGFTYVGSPPPAPITPALGPITGGTAVTIKGFDFVSGATVTIGGVSATSIAVVDSATITAVTGGHTRQGYDDVVVTNPGGSPKIWSAAFTYYEYPPPVVQSITPTSGPTTGGTAVTITGTGFQPGSRVKQGSLNASAVVVVNSTTITAVLMPHAPGTDGIWVMGPPGVADALLPDAFTYVGAPPPATVTPVLGPPAGGTAVTIRGFDFAAGATVTIGGVSATSIAVVNSTTITAITGAHAAGYEDLVVTNPGGSPKTWPAAYAYTDPPNPTAIVPATGSILGGTAITIQGTHFEPGATATIGGASLTSVVVVNSTTMTAVTPPLVEGFVSITVKNPDGFTGTLVNGFQYTMFTNDPLVAEGTAIRAIHIMELRSFIDALWGRYGLVPGAWTDATVTAGSTIIKAIHLSEIQTALRTAYFAAGRSEPSFSATPAGTLIAAAHLSEIRSAIRAIW